MKVIGKYFLIIVLSLVVFLLGFNHKDNKQPNVLYKVYLDSELIGTIESRDSFKRMIDDAMSGNIDLIITKSITRFARNTVTLLETVTFFYIIKIINWHTISFTTKVKYNYTSLYPTI